MRAGKFQNGDDMFIGERVDDVLSVPPRLHDSIRLEKAQLVAYGALCAPDRLDDVKDAHLPVAQGK